MGIYSNINVSVGKAINTLGGIVALKGYQPRQLVDGDTVVVTGLDEGVDGQGGVYVWSEASTATSDNFQTVQPVFVIGKGRWLRLFNGVGGPSGPSTKANFAEYQVAGSKVVGSRGSAVASAVVSTAAPTKAEFDALVGVVNALRDRLRVSTGHGLISD